MQLDGRLSSFPLRELLELSSTSLVNGAIEVQAPSGVHHLFFVQGRLVHATGPDASGFEAFWPLFELKDGSFRFVVGAATRVCTIVAPLPELITQAETLAQQWARIRPLVPNLDIVPELVMQTKDDHVRIFEEDWPILSAVDGLRTIAEVARAARLEVLQVCVGLLRLRERGLVRFSHRRTASSSSASKAPGAAREPEAIGQAVSQPATRAGFFTKLLADLPAQLCEPSALKLPAAPESPGLPPSTSEHDDILRLLRS